MYIDSHCHITCDELFEHKDEIIQNARDAGLGMMMIMCTSPEELERALPIKAENPDLFKVAFGWFPEEAQNMTDEMYAYLEKTAASGKIDVLGEIGLDYYWDKSYKEEQKELFRRQIEIANRYDLPISIHMRDASRDTLDILKEHAHTPIIFHCFSGSGEILKEALKLDSLISYAGPITFKNNKTGPVNVQNTPADRILSETDSPYLTPVPLRGQRNQPAYVIHTVEKIADLKNMSSEELQQQIENNFRSLFQRKKSV